MGVAGLWDILRPAATTRSLTDLAIKEGFQANPDGRRGFRLGIDASIWFFHAEYGKEGENPVLRTLFFRCATLMRTTFLPIFIFDGPKRPDIKRGKKINKTGNKLIPGMKQIVEAFGFEWRTAPGEAEAELAYLNRIGVIDGILSDDVDNFLFGATVVIRNSSNTLSGNRANPVLNAAGKDDRNHTRIFRLEDVSAHPGIRLTRGGMILIGLMSGGDYQQGGVMRCGTTTAHGLAKCGFGDSLYTAATNLSRIQLAEFLVNWRHELRHELKTNSRGEIGRKQPSLSKAIPEDFPDIDILLSYVTPITSETMGRESNNLKLTWTKEPDLAKLAALCEFYFEWGYKESIIKRFRTIMWHSITLRILRRAVLDLDAYAKLSTPSPPATPRKKGSQASGTPSKLITQHFASLNIATPPKGDVFNSDSESQADTDERLILKIHGTRTHVSTDGMLEYRLEIAPKRLVKMAESGIKGTRVPEGPDEWASEEDEDEDARTRKGGQKVPVDPETHLRLWMPACMVALVEPQLVEEYEEIKAQRGKKKSKSNRADTQAGKASKKTTSNSKSKVKDNAPHSLAETGSSMVSKPSIPWLEEEELPGADDPGPSRSKDRTAKTISNREVETISTAKTTFSRTDHELDTLSVPTVKCNTSIRDLTKSRVSKSRIATTDALKAFFPTVIPSSSTKQPALRVKSTIKTDNLSSISMRDSGRVISEVASRKTEATTTPLLSTKPITMSPSKRKAKSVLVVSCSDSDSQHHNKSPRKSVKNASPGRKRPVSPTPGASRSTQTKFYDKVIEVSSDSDSDGSLPNRVALPPLLAARARATTQSNKDRTLYLKQVNKNNLAYSSEIIDLT